MKIAYKLYSYVFFLLHIDIVYVVSQIDNGY